MTDMIIQHNFHFNLFDVTSLHQVDWMKLCCVGLPLITVTFQIMNDKILVKVSNIKSDIQICIIKEYFK